MSTTTTIPNKKPETTSTIYDLNGRVIEEIDKQDRKTTYQYDNMGRVVLKTLTYGDESRTTTTTYGYEDNFYVITGTGANKRLPTVAVVTEKNANDEVISQTYTDPYGQTVREESNGIHMMQTEIRYWNRQWYRRRRLLRRYRRSMMRIIS